MGEAATVARIDASRQAEVVRRLREFLPESAVLFEDEDTRPYECDGLTAYRRVPMVVALPETDEQVRRVLQTCSALAVPNTCWWATSFSSNSVRAGTGLSGPQSAWA